MPAKPLLWDVFCRVIDNHGDLGVCWRLARVLAARGQRVRLWVDAPEALDWMAPGARAGAFEGVQVRPWPAASDAGVLAALAPAQVWVEAFGCELPPEFVAWGARAVAGGECRPVWVNLEYLSAEPYVERMHRLPSPVQHGPAAGWQKWFFYPGFTRATGGLLREADLPTRQAAFNRTTWLAAQGVAWRGERLVSLFCYEPPALAAWLAQLQAGPEPVHLLVTAGRAAQAVRAIFSGQIGLLRNPIQRGKLSISYLPLLPQTAFDELLWACDFNAVRGEDSWVRALWAGRPFVWQPYPQHDGAHQAKLAAFLDWLGAPADLRAFHRVWSGIDAAPLPPLNLPAWGEAVNAARTRLLSQPDLAAQLIGFAHEKQ